MHKNKLKNMRKLLVATTVAICVHGAAARAETVPAPGYIYSRELLSEMTEGCIEQVVDGVFVGVGPMLSFPAAGATRDILFVAQDGSVRTVATGFNAISDCVYDVDTDTLYVTDSGAEFAGAATGDTVFAIPASGSDQPIAGLELLPSGTFPYAYSIDILGDGLLVSDAEGGGLGRVLEIDLSGVTPSVSTFASGFDYTGGLCVNSSDVFVAEALQPNFDSAIYRYSSTGSFTSTVSGPTFEHGSNDLAVASDGRLLVTGGSTIVAVDPLGVTVPTPLVTGLIGGGAFPAFGGGLSVDPFSGRIAFLASSFTGADDDKSIHRLVPIDRLVAGGGSDTTDCAVEFYGLELVPTAPGRPARSAICVDGASCDADGEADGKCRFPLGLCLKVSDPRLPECTPSGVPGIELVSVKPETLDLSGLVAAANAVLPADESTCVFGEGVDVEVRTLSNGATRAGKARIRLSTTADNENPRKDRDVAKLVCEPAP